MEVCFSVLVAVKGKVEQGGQDMDLMLEKYGLKCIALLSWEFCNLLEH